MAAPDYVTKAKISSIEQKLVNLTSLICQLAVDKLQTVEAYGICAAVGHPTDMCPTLREESYEQVNAVGDFPGQPRWRYDPYSYTYNSGLRDHPNFSYGNLQMNQPTHQNFPSYQQYRQPYPQQQQGQPSNSNMSLEDIVNSFPQTSNFNMSLEDIVKALNTNTLQFEQESKQFRQQARASMQSLNNQMGQIATAIDQLDEQSYVQVPSQTIVNQKENESAIVLRSGNAVENLEKTVLTSQKQEEADNINTKVDSVNADKNVRCDDDIPKVEEVVEQTDKKKLEDAITNSLGLEKEEEIKQNQDLKEEEIEQNQDLKEAVATLHSLPVTLDSDAVFFIQLPVTNKKSLPSILQISIPDLKPLPNHLKYLLLEEGVKHSYQPQEKLNLPMMDNVMDGVLKIQEIGVT